jgi:hypothetical protein
MDYEQDVKIDSDSLDIECLEQPTLMLKYTRHLASCEREKDRAKEKLELVRAELDRKIRLNPEKFKIDKLTDKVVENTIPMQDDFIDASDAFIEAKYEWNTARGVVDSIEQRKAMLEAMIRLHGQQYFAGPKVPRDLADEVKKKNMHREVNEITRIGRRK